MDQAWYASKIAWFQTHKDDSYGSPEYRFALLYPTLHSSTSFCRCQMIHPEQQTCFLFKGHHHWGSIILTYLSRGEVWAWRPQNIFFWLKNEKNPLQDDGKRLRVAKCSDPAVAALLCGSYKCAHPGSKTKHGTNEDFHQLRVKYLAICSLPDLRFIINHGEQGKQPHIWVWVNTVLIPFLMGWTSIYQLFWGSLGVQGFDTLPYPEITSLQGLWEITNLPRIPAPSSSCGSSFSRYAGFQNHGKVVYLKEVSEESPEAITHCFVSGVGSLWLPSYPKRFCFCCEAFYLYFWSDDVPDFQGWWFGPQHVAKWNITPRQSIFGRYRPDHHHPTVLEVLNQRPQGSIVVYA